VQNRVVDQADIDLRNRTYHQFVELGRAPTATEMARTTGLGVDDVRSGWRRLHEAHALVLNPATVELRMVNPFSAVPTAFRVQAAGRWWYANCAWDAFGICATLHADGRIEASCPDCGAPVAIAVANQQPDDSSLLFHCLVPAVRWWDDIVFT
jgi:alkylmercury lyase-like protein